MNAMALMEKDGSMELYAGCGDNNVYVFDLENQKLKVQLWTTLSFVTDLVCGTILKRLVICRLCSVHFLAIPTMFIVWPCAVKRKVEYAGLEEKMGQCWLGVRSCFS